MCFFFGGLFANKSSLPCTNWVSETKLQLHAFIFCIVSVFHIRMPCIFIGICLSYSNAFHRNMPFIFVCLSYSYAFHIRICLSYSYAINSIINFKLMERNDKSLYKTTVFHWNRIILIFCIIYIHLKHSPHTICPF